MNVHDEALNIYFFRKKISTTKKGCIHPLYLCTNKRKENSFVDKNRALVYWMYGRSVMPKWRLDSTLHSIDKSYMEPVAQWVERQFVALVVAGSNPVGLPNRYHGFTVI